MMVGVRWGSGDRIMDVNDIRSVELVEFPPPPGSQTAGVCQQSIITRSGVLG